MPAPNIIQFSLNEDQRTKLSSFTLDDESLGLTAKRLLLSLIGEENDQPVTSNSKGLEELEERIKEVVDRLEKIEDDRLSQLEQKFKALEQDRDQLLIRIATLQDEKRKLLEEPVQIRMAELTKEFERQLGDLPRALARLDYMQRDLERINEKVSEDNLSSYLSNYLSNYLPSDLSSDLSNKKEVEDLFPPEKNHLTLYEEGDELVAFDEEAANLRREIKHYKFRFAPGSVHGFGCVALAFPMEDKEILEEIKATFILKVLPKSDDRGLRIELTEEEIEKGLTSDVLAKYLGIGQRAINYHAKKGLYGEWKYNKKTKLWTLDHTIFSSAGD